MIQAPPDRLLPGSYNAYGYEAANVLRTSGRGLPSDGSGDRHLRADRELIGREADRLDRDNFLYESLLNRAGEAILGRDGFALKFETPDPDLNDRMLADFKRWAKRPEVTQQFNWRDCEWLALRAYFNRGDIGFARTNRALVQYVEAARIVSDRYTVAPLPNGGLIDQGVEVDAANVPQGYYVAPYDTWGNVDRAKAVRVAAENFGLFAHRKKLSQRRGSAVMATVMPLIHRLNDILDSEAIAWQNLARFALLFSWPGAPASAHASSQADEDEGEGTPTSGELAERVHDTEAGTFIWGEPGADAKPIPREYPGAQFPESVRMYLRLVGMPFGMPLSFLLLDYSDTTYTSSRAELEQAFRVHIRRQRDLKHGHHDPITEWWIRWGIERGRYPEPPAGYEFDDFYRFTWSAPEFPWIDQLKEAQAWGKRIDRGLATQDEALRSVGSSFDRHLELRAAEIRRCMAEAVELNKNLPAGVAPVDWRLLAGYEISRQETRTGNEKSDQTLQGAT